MFYNTFSKSRKRRNSNIKHFAYISVVSFSMQCFQTCENVFFVCLSYEQIQLCDFIQDFSWTQTHYLFDCKLYNKPMTQRLWQFKEKRVCTVDVRQSYSIHYVINLHPCNHETWSGSMSLNSKSPAVFFVFYLLNNKNI